MERLPLRLQAKSEHVFEDGDGLISESSCRGRANQAMICEYVGFNISCFHLCCRLETFHQMTFVREVTQGKVIPADRPGTRRDSPLNVGRE